MANGMTMRWLCALVAVLMLSGCDRAAPGGAAADEWHGFGNTGAEQHYSPLDEIGAANVADLKLAWFADLPQGNTATGPVMAEGKVFVTTGHGHVRAFDAASGKALWDHDSGAREASTVLQLRLGGGPKGLADDNGRGFLGTHDGRVIALDAGNGKLAWEQRDYPAGDMRYTNGPVRVFDGKVIVGHGGADYTPLRGWVTAYDAQTGTTACAGAAAAPCGTRCRTIPNSASSTSASATAFPTTRRCAARKAATTCSSPRSSRFARIPANMSGTTSSAPASSGTARQHRT